MTPLDVLVVALGAGVGAVCRSATDRVVFARFGPTRLPWATLAVNIAGSFVLGLALGATADALAAGGPAADPAHTLRLVAGTGFAGGLTTFSTFTWEVSSLAREGRERAGLVYAALTMATTLVAVALGTVLGRALG